MRQFFVRLSRRLRSKPDTAFKRPRALMDSDGSWWILLDLYRFFQVLPEFLAAFRLKNFRSCFYSYWYFSVTVLVYVILGKIMFNQSFIINKWRLQEEIWFTSQECEPFLSIFVKSMFLQSVIFKSHICFFLVLIKSLPKNSKEFIFSISHSYGAKGA